MCKRIAMEGEGSVILNGYADVDEAIMELADVAAALTASATMVHLCGKCEQPYEIIICRKANATLVTIRYHGERALTSLMYNDQIVSEFYDEYFGESVSILEGAVPRYLVVDLMMTVSLLSYPKTRITITGNDRIAVPDDEELELEFEE